MQKLSVLSFFALVLVGTPTWGGVENLPTDVIVVHHAPVISDGATVKGNVRVLSGTNFALVDAATVTGSLLMPGTPTITKQKNATYSGIITGTGNQVPTHYTIKLQDHARVGYIHTRIDPIAMPTVPVVPAPLGKRQVTLSKASDTPGNFASIRHLALTHRVGPVVVPAGTYGTFTLCSQATMVFGVAGSTTPAVYNLHSLELADDSRLLIAGPVQLNIAEKFRADGVSVTGNAAHPDWLRLNIQGGSVMLARKSAVYGVLTAPTSHLQIKEHAYLKGRVWCDHVVLTDHATVEWCADSNPPPTNHAPVALPASFALSENTFFNGMASATDADGDALSYRVVGQPAHGSVMLNAATGAFAYAPATGYNGGDTFTFKANDGATDSNTATVSIMVTPPPPVAPTITVQPAGVTVATGQPATFTVLASGYPVPAYQWQSSRDGADWADIPGAVVAACTLPTPNDDSGKTIRCVVTNSLGTVTSTTATLTLTLPTWTTVTGGSWAAGQANCKNGIFVDGTNAGLDFSTLALPADTRITLDGSHTAGYLVFGDTAAAHSWLVETGTGGVLTLDSSAGTPVINVVNQTLVVSATLAGNDGLRKTGSGALILAGSNLYTGDTTVSDGELRVNGTLAVGGAVTVAAAGKLSGTGVINSDLTVQGILSPGASIGTLTVNGAVTVAPTGTMYLEINPALGTSDRVQGISTLVCAGTLTVVNLDGVLAAGHHFTLFSAARSAGSFTTMLLPPLPTGLGWDTAQLGVDGSIRVADTAPPVITLTGKNNVIVTWGSACKDLGATAIDTVDGECLITVTGTVDTAVAGRYTITYTAVDAAGNPASATRTVTVIGTSDDYDEDGLANVREMVLGTDPRNPDTDGDGLADGQEVNVYHSNPLRTDSNGDGVDDGTTVSNGQNPIAFSGGFIVSQNGVLLDKPVMEISLASGDKIGLGTTNPWSTDGTVINGLANGWQNWDANEWWQTCRDQEYWQAPWWDGTRPDLATAWLETTWLQEDWWQQQWREVETDYADTQTQLDALQIEAWTELWPLWEEVLDAYMPESEWLIAQHLLQLELYVKPITDVNYDAMLEQLESDWHQHYGPSLGDAAPWYAVMETNYMRCDCNDMNPAVFVDWMHQHNTFWAAVQAFNMKVRDIRDRRAAMVAALAAKELARRELWQASLAAESTLAETWWAADWSQGAWATLQLPGGSANYWTQTWLGQGNLLYTKMNAASPWATPAWNQWRGQIWQAQGNTNWYKWAYASSPGYWLDPSGKASSGDWYTLWQNFGNDSYNISSTQFSCWNEVGNWSYQGSHWETARLERQVLMNLKSMDNTDNLESLDICNYSWDSWNDCWTTWRDNTGQSAAWHAAYVAQWQLQIANSGLWWTTAQAAWQKALNTWKTSSALALQQGKTDWWTAWHAQHDLWRSWQDGWLAESFWQKMVPQWAQWSKVELTVTASDDPTLPVGTVLNTGTAALAFNNSGDYELKARYLRTFGGTEECVSESAVAVHVDPLPYPRDVEQSCKSSCTACGGGVAVGVSSSLEIEMPMGVVPLTGEGVGRLRLYSHRAAAALFRPESLVFASAFGTRVLSTRTNQDNSQDVTLLREDGKQVKYHFLAGAAEGVPTGAQSHFHSRLVKAGAYYDRYMEDGAVIRYDAGNGAMVSTREASGQVFTAADAQFELVMVGGVLRQVKATDMLLDIVVTQKDLAYEVRSYPSAQVGAKDASGVYGVSGNPLRTFKVANPTGDTNQTNRLTFTSSASGADEVYNYTFDRTAQQWTLVQPGNLAAVSRSISAYDAGKRRTIKDTVMDANGNVVSVHKAICRMVGDDGQEVTDSETVDAGGLNQMTSFSWYENSAEPGRYRRLREVSRPDGSWTQYDYDVNGRITSVVQPYQDFDSRTTLYSYSPVDSSDIVPTTDNRPRLETETINGIVTGKTWHVYMIVNGAASEITERAASQGASYGAAGNQRTTSTYYSAGRGVFSGRLHTVESSDGSLTTYAYERGTYSSAPDAGACTFTLSAVGDAVRTTVMRGTTMHADGIAFKSTRSVSVMDGLGRGVMSETWVKADAGFERIAWTVNEFDAYGHVTKSTNSGGVTASAEWSCCTKQSETTADGTQFVYSYDQMKRLLTQTKVDVGNQADVVTSYTYDADGRVLSTTVTGGGLSLTTRSTYDAAGRILTSTDAAGRVTSYAYSAGGRITTVTLPGGATQVTENYTDGSVKANGGSAVVAQYAASGVNADGTRWSQTNVAAPDSPAWSKSTADFLGRTVKRESPGVGGASVLVAESFYDATTGWLLKSTQPGAAAALYEYDELGNVTRSGLDVDGNNTLDLGGQDRVQEAEARYSQDTNGDWWQLSTGKTYLTASSATATVTGVTKSRITGLGTAAPEPYRGVLSGETIAIDLRGNIATSRTYTDAATATAWQVVQSPDSTLPSITKSVNSLAVSGTTKAGQIFLSVHDALGRQTGTTDPRTGTAVTHYDALGQVDYVQDASGAKTIFTYDAAGHPVIIENALGKKSYTAYDAMGRVERTWGDVGYPAIYVYDAYGHLIFLLTYRDSSANFSTPTWPDNLGEPNLTQWIYDDGSGRLLQKKYRTASFQHSGYCVQDGDTGEILQKWYDDGSGNLTLVWSRDADTAQTIQRILGAVTVANDISCNAKVTQLLRDDYGFSYDDFPDGSWVLGWMFPDPATGRYFFLGSVCDAWDESTATTYTYDAANRLATRTWARPQSSTGVSPVIPLVTTYSYSPTTGELTDTSYSDTTPAVAYTYNRIGQPLTVTDAAGTRTFAYSAITGELQSETLPTAFYGIPGTAPAAPQARVLTRQYDSLGRSAGYQLLGANSTVETATGYTYDTYGRLEKVYRGTPISGLASLASYTYTPNSNLLATTTRSNGVTTAYTYEEHRDLITSVSHTLGAPVPSPASIISAFTYTNDPLARRTQMLKSGQAFSTPDQISYTYNPRSELTAAESSLAAQNNYTYSFNYDPIGNRQTASQGVPDSPTFQTSTYTTNSLNQYLSVSTTLGAPVPSPASVTSPTFDADGNQLTLVNQTGTWTLAYNAENRLISAESATQRLEFVYDYQGRRIAKKNLSVAAGVPPALVSATAYLYDGWNLIAELDLMNAQAMVRSHIWGLDLSGSMQGAGGVGGLLCSFSTANNTPAATFPVYDGNGNVTALFDATGLTVASYEYDPFGKTILKSGSSVDTNPFRFSTKYFDAETGLYYYGFRYYMPETGRWLSRDLIGENDGPAIYGYVRNNPVSGIDPFGLALYAFDGTNNLPADQTNVWLMHRFGWNGNRKHYESGIGNVQEYSVFTQIMRQATGWGMEAKKSKMLRFMAELIKDGDTDVDVIGFSRGAVTAVFFAAAIEKLIKENVYPYCKIKKIRFLGLYDPVPGPFITSPEKISDIVQKTAIAYSLDEKRTTFKPTIYHAGANVISSGFRGGHSDIGGGYSERGLANITLEWMVDQGIAAGAPFTAYPQSSKGTLMKPHRESFPSSITLADRVFAPGNGMTMHSSVRRLALNPRPIPTISNPGSMYIIPLIDPTAFYLDNADGTTFYQAGDRKFQ